MKTSKNVILPRLDNVQDPEVKKVFQELLKALKKMNVTHYGDLVGHEERITTLEP